MLIKNVFLQVSSENWRPQTGSDKRQEDKSGGVYLCTSGTSGLRPLKQLSKHLQNSHGIAAAKASIAQTMLEEAMAADDQVISKLINGL